MQHGVGGAAEGDDHGDGILERLPGHDIPRANAELKEIQNCSSGVAAVLFLGGTDRCLGAAAGQAHAHGFNGAGHGVCSVHATTGTGAGDGAALDLMQVFVGDLVDGIALTIGNHQAVGKIFVLQGPREYTFVEMVGVLEDQLRRKTLKIFLPVLIVKILVYFLYLLKSKSIYRDQIPRLLCTKSEGDYSFVYLGIRPRRLEDAIKINFHS